MQVNNTSDAWPLVGLNVSAVASSTMISIIAFARELTSTLLEILQRVCLPHILVCRCKSQTLVGKQYLRCMAACRIRRFCHRLHIRMHFHPHLFLFTHSHARYLACSQKSFPFANGIQFANRTKCSRTDSVRGWDGTYIWSVEWIVVFGIYSGLMTCDSIWCIE